eukprot:scaffold2408_cov386-Prasinococcus_capsulatus_cf.AAC.10
MRATRLRPPRPTRRRPRGAARAARTAWLRSPASPRRLPDGPAHPHPAHISSTSAPRHPSAIAALSASHGGAGAEARALASIPCGRGHLDGSCPTSPSPGAVGLVGGLVLRSGSRESRTPLQAQNDGDDNSSR